MRVGFASIDITPPLGVPLAGYASRVSGATHVLDELRCRCVSLDADGGPVTVAVLDLLGIGFQLANRVRELLGGDDRVLLVATHTHSAPDIERCPREYVEELARRVATCIRESRNAMQESMGILVKKTLVPDLVYNRRKPADGPTDPRLWVVSFKPRSPKLVVAHYTCHGVVLGPDNYGVSGDWPGALARYLSSMLGVESVAVLNGCCGDINPFTPSTKLEKPYDRRGATYEELELFAKTLAHAASSLALTWWRGVEEPLDRAVALRRDVELELARVSVDRSELVEKARAGDRYAQWLLRRLDYVEELRKLFGEAIRVRVWCLVVSESTAFVFLPSEVFVEHQLWISSRSPFRNTIVVGYAEPYIGYIPTEEAFDEGGYEAQFPVAIVARGSGEKLRLVALELLSEARELVK